MEQEDLVVSNTSSRTGEMSMDETGGECDSPRECFFCT